MMQTYHVAILGETDWKDTVVKRSASIAKLRLKLIGDLQTDILDVQPEVYGADGRFIGMLWCRHTRNGWEWYWETPVKTFMFWDKTNPAFSWKKMKFKRSTVDLRTGNLKSGKGSVSKTYPLDPNRWW